MIEAMTKWIETLLMIDDTPTSQRRWRVTIAMSCMIFMIHIVWATGYLTVFGFDGFVKGRQLSQVQAQIATLTQISQEFQLRIIRKQLIESRVWQCKATEKMYFEQRLAELRDEYYRLTHQSWQTPKCDEVI